MAALSYGVTPGSSSPAWLSPRLREAHKNPTSRRSGGSPHWKPTDKTGFHGTRRHGCYYGRVRLLTSMNAVELGLAQLPWDHGPRAIEPLVNGRSAVRIRSPAPSVLGLGPVAGHGRQLARQPREASGVEAGELLAIHPASAFPHNYRPRPVPALTSNTSTVTSWLPRISTDQMTRRCTQEPCPFPPYARKENHPQRLTVIHGQPALLLTCVTAGPLAAVTSFASWDHLSHRVNTKTRAGIRIKAVLQRIRM
jgi:hypothetical protein